MSDWEQNLENDPEYIIWVESLRNNWIESLEQEITQEKLTTPGEDANIMA